MVLKVVTKTHFSDTWELAKVPTMSDMAQYEHEIQRQERQVSALKYCTCALERGDGWGNSEPMQSRVSGTDLGASPCGSQRYSLPGREVQNFTLSVGSCSRFEVSSRMG